MSSSFPLLLQSLPNRSLVDSRLIVPTRRLYRTVRPPIFSLSSFSQAPWHWASVPPQNLDGPLQRSQVREYIRLRLETYQFQEQMKSNAGQYDNLPRPFLKRRNKHLRAEGKTTSRWSCHRRLPRRPVRCAGPLVPRSPTPSGGATKC